ncbi:MAG TPA: methyltransferase domain-containing protein [Nitrospiria bacterium]|nr:methyltransferase domain-containing protein [Nitrospiria bacterium]
MDTEKIEKVYSIYSGFYDLLFGKIFHDSRHTAIKLLSIQPGERILEVGVGTGLALPLYPQDCQVVGIDLTGPMLEKGIDKIARRKLHHIHLQQMDATHMAFAEDSFDAVMAAYVMSAVPQPHSVLSEMCRVCRPGGRIVLLNHFSNGNPVLSRLEKSISPLCTKIGFRTDLSLEELLEGSPLAIQQKLKVNPFRYWQVVQCINRKPANGSAH